ncbi:MAG: Abi-alpha family protein [Pseudomonadota bacterium]
MSENNEIIETAKATQEVAKATGKAIDASSRFGEFMSRFIAGPLEQGAGIFEDKLRYMRWERQVRLMKKAEAFMQELSITGDLRPIPMKHAIPLFQAASLEDDDYLQDLWVKLLVNASAPNSSVVLRRAHIDILERLSAVEAQILQRIYAHSEEELDRQAVLTYKLPDVAEIEIEELKNKSHSLQPTSEVKLALANLSRLGCVGLPTAWDGGEIFTAVYPTIMGRSLFEACSEPVDGKN